ncbi:peptidoglycan DD-metalloendopeptidase family protein [Marinomonas ostreistagni]|uniref:Peptidoglycan DD-metalloendopeptidase family protein n=1 Tax=Marinomonas ostreistagni TaxID=359209 RepID=A0ABS0Z6W7_9GAMM|nr:peptidoglycan DD-metalloendopeptidase family protein [Marinomonas ostreistagni]MBJ7549339.1 peptidoglycan DD-metalloendopeptidase family protein [Marinomonas ostreistagni]
MLTKSLLTVSVSLLVAGTATLFWALTPTSNETQETTIQSRQSAGPVPQKANLTSPLDQQKKAQTLQATTIILKAGDSLSRTLNRLGISDRQIAELLEADQANVLTTLQPGQKLMVQRWMPNQRLESLTLSPNKEKAYIFQHNSEQGNFSYREQLSPVEKKLRYQEVEISSSLFLDGTRSGLSDKTLLELTNIFRWDIDFALDLRQGDRFAMLLEERYINGELLDSGEIIAAQFINNGRVFEAIRYQLNSGTDYFTRDGLSLRKAFIRSPVEFTHVSSKFNPNRLHPIFKTTRPHQGVDYAAPEGTPVYSSGDGIISFVGNMKGYGNTIIIDHGKGFSTLYAHLSEFSDGLIAGQEIRQGSEIAKVGQTGWATGPHLHYEFRIQGQHKNPETVDIPYDSPMNKDELVNFLPYAEQIMARLQRSQSSDFSQYLSQLSRR